MSGTKFRRTKPENTSLDSLPSLPAALYPPIIAGQTTPGQRSARRTDRPDARNPRGRRYLDYRRRPNPVRREGDDVRSIHISRFSALLN